MSWAEVFKINENTKNVVGDSMSLVASDTNVYALFPDEIMYNAAIPTSDICTITLPHAGSIKLKYNFSRNTNYTSSESNKATFTITKNGTQTVFSTYTYSMTTEDAYVTLYGEKGDVFKLSVAEGKSGMNSMFLYLYSILATVTPAKTVTITAL